MNKFYLINYNRLIEKDTNYLLSILFDNNQTMKLIAWDILLNDDRLLDNEIDEEILKEIVKEIKIEDVWYLASLDKKYKITKIAYNQLMEIIDETEVLENRKLIKMLNKKMPS